MITCCTVPDIWRVAVVIIFHFGPFFALLSPKIKIKKKMKETSGDIIILQECTKNHDHMLYCSWDIVRDRCNCYFSFGAIYASIYVYSFYSFLFFSLSLSLFFLFFFLLFFNLIYYLFYHYHYYNYYNNCLCLCVLYVCRPCWEMYKISWRSKSCFVFVFQNFFIFVLLNCESL